MLRTIPQRPAGGTHIVRKGLGPNVEIPDMSGCSKALRERARTALSRETDQIDSQQTDHDRAGDPDEQPTGLGNPGEQIVEPFHPAGPARVDPVVALVRVGP